MRAPSSSWLRRPRCSRLRLDFRPLPPCCPPPGCLSAASKPVASTVASKLAISEVEVKGREKVSEIEAEAEAEQAADFNKHSEDDLKHHKTSWGLKAKVAGETAGALANLLQNLYQVFGSKSKGLFKAMKAAAIAETIFQTARAVRGSFKAYEKIPPPLGPAMGAAAAAAAVVAGAARIYTIINAEPENATGTIDTKGLANPDYKGGSANAYPVPDKVLPASMPTKDVTIVVHDTLNEHDWAEIVENELIPEINEAANRNIHLTVETAA